MTLTSVKSTSISRLSSIKAFYLRHERRLSIAFFGMGFLWDTITLQRIDLFYENIVFAWNLFLAGAAIALINLHETKKLSWRPVRRAAPFLPVVMQFSFGALFSAFTVFYFKSGSVSASWPFLIFLLALFIGNEFFRKRYTRLTFQLSIYFVALFSYAAFVLPILLGKMGPVVYAASGIVALGAIGAVIFALYRFIPDRVRQNKKSLVLSIGSIFAAFQLAYIFNIIPPIPLALKESGIYHSVTPKSQDGFIYEVTYEPAPWYKPLAKEHDVFHWRPGAIAYSYTAVFAPTKISVNIYHRWMYFDEQTSQWQDKGKISFPITGGRDGGYRGYTFNRNLAPGKWRVDVVTESNQVLGRRHFHVEQTQTPPELKTTFR